MKELEALCISLRNAATSLAVLTAAQKNCALTAVSDAINRNRAFILDANKMDVEAARAAGTKDTLIDRMLLTDSRIDGMIESIGIVIAQKDPIGFIPEGWTIENGLQIIKTRVPLGVAAIIYESRPNVTVDAFALAYKSGNAILLRGSSSAFQSNNAIVRAIKEGLTKSGLPNAVELVPPPEVPHIDVDWMLQARGYIDVLLPRGNAPLISRVVNNAKVPVIETGTGNCHIFIDESADLAKAVAITVNAKMQRPGVCNAAEKLLVHTAVAKTFLPLLAKEIASYTGKTGRVGGCEFRCDKESLTILQDTGVPQQCIPATESDWDEEFLDYILGIRVVESVHEAIIHINAHTTHHSEAIVTNNLGNTRLFKQKIDAACVYINASTRFTDGGVFGFGTELGISTQKMHIRGPMGLETLTTIKYIIDGDGQIR